MAVELEGMSDIEDRQPDPAAAGAAPQVDADRSRGRAVRHVALAVPIRAVERNRRVASSVLAGGLPIACSCGCCRSA